MSTTMKDDDAEAVTKEKQKRKVQLVFELFRTHIWLLIFSVIALISTFTFIYSIDKLNKERSVANEAIKAKYETCFCKYVNWTNTTARLYDTVQYVDWGTADMQAHCNNTEYHFGRSIYRSRPSNETCYRSLEPPNAVVPQIPYLNGWSSDSSYAGWLTSLIFFVSAAVGLSVAIKVRAL